MYCHHSAYILEFHFISFVYQLSSPKFVIEKNLIFLEANQGFAIFPMKVRKYIIKVKNFASLFILFDKCKHFCKWTARMAQLGTPPVVNFIHTVRHVHVLDHGPFKIKSDAKFLTFMIYFLTFMGKIAKPWFAISLE
jgi:hypothetical protein